MSNNRDNTVAAHKRGYRVDAVGDVYYKDRKRRLILCSKGYKTFTIRVKIDGADKLRRIWVHKLQAYQKFGDASFASGVHVRHLDGDKVNNSHQNIGIGTASDNMMDKKPEDRSRSGIRASSFVKKHDHEAIIQMRKSGMTYLQIMTKTGIKSKGTISFILNKSKANRNPPSNLTELKKAFDAAFGPNPDFDPSDLPE